MFKLGVITDEVSQSLEEAARFAQCFHLDGVELRSVAGRGPFDWTMDDVKGFRKVLDGYGLQAAAVSSPLFKCDLTDTAEIARQVDAFRRCADFCGELRCKIIRGFDFWNVGADAHRRAEQFQPIAAICREYGLTCALEYDPSVHASTPPLLRQLLDAIDAPEIRALFDPGNGIFSRPDSRPFPDDYELLSPVLCHIHVKDARPTDQGVQAVCVGDGLVNYAALLPRLIRDGYAGYVMLETHYRLKGALTEAQLKLPGGHAFSDGAYEASYESMTALRALIDEAKMKIQEG